MILFTDAELPCSDSVPSFPSTATPPPCGRRGQHTASLGKHAVDMRYGHSGRGPEGTAELAGTKPTWRVAPE